MEKIKSVTSAIIELAFLKASFNQLCQSAQLTGSILCHAMGIFVDYTCCEGMASLWESTKSSQSGTTVLYDTALCLLM